VPEESTISKLVLMENGSQCVFRKEEEREREGGGGKKKEDGVKEIRN